MPLSEVAATEMQYSDALSMKSNGGVGTKLLLLMLVYIPRGLSQLEPYVTLTVHCWMLFAGDDLKNWQ